MYFKQFLTYENSYAQSVELVTRIQSIEGYTSETEIVFLGLPPRDTGNTEMDFIRVTGVTGIYGEYSYPIFLRRYLNFTQPIEVAEQGLLEDSEIASAVADMPTYPAAGSIAFINDKIYVKFIDPSD